MVRSNRTSTTNNNATSTASANVDALDNIDLDGMFADDGDALFDGLDIDLGNIDEITGSGNGRNKPQQRSINTGAPSSSAAPTGPRVSSHRNREGLISPMATTADDSNAVSSVSGSKSNRRQLKRKTKYTGYEYDDESIYEVPSSSSSKKTKPAAPDNTKQQSSATTTSSVELKGTNNYNGDNVRPGSKTKQKQGSSSVVGNNNNRSNKYQEDADGSQQLSSILTNKDSNKSGIHSAQHVSIMSAPSSVVAAAGQFGSRNKRGGTASTLESSSLSTSTTFASLPKVVKGNKLPLMRSSAAVVGALNTKKGSTNVKTQHYQQEHQQQATSAKTRQRIDMPKSSAAAAIPSSSASVGSSTSTASVSTIGSSSKRRLKPPPKEYCGLDPSDTLFYPFMAALPSEPTMKSRKTYPFVDRAHSTFINQLSNTLDVATTLASTKIHQTEPIFNLLEEAFREDIAMSATDATKKNTTMSNAITMARSSISQCDRNKLAEDLFSACSLLQKQHDFLRQNAVNMKRWCRQNFDENDYTNLFKSQNDIEDYDYYFDDDSSAVTVLESFGKRNLIVKLVCDGFREPGNKSAPSILVARLPPEFEPAMPPPPPPKVRQASPVPPDTLRQSTDVKPTSKKRKYPSSSTHGSDISLKAPPSPVFDVPKTFFTNLKNVSTIPYATLQPFERRISLSQSLSRTAREIDAKYINRSKDARADVRGQDAALQKFLDDDNSSMMMHTVGMWKFMELSGYFKILTESEVQDRLHDFRLTEPVQEAGSHGSLILSNANCAYDRARVNTTAVDRLQSLLVEESDSIDSDNSDDDTQCQIDKWEIQIMDEFQADSMQNSDVVNMSALSVDERAILQWKHIGFTENVPQLSSRTSTDLSSTNHVELIHGRQIYGNDPGFDSWGRCELDNVTDEMMRDFNDVNVLNDHRASFLESASKTIRYRSLDEFHSRNEYEKSIIALCGQLIKSKEATKARQDWPITCPSNSYN